MPRRSFAPARTLNTGAHRRVFAVGPLRLFPEEVCAAAQVVDYSPAMRRCTVWRTEVSDRDSGRARGFVLVRTIRNSNRFTFDLRGLDDEAKRLVAKVQNAVINTPYDDSGIDDPHQQALAALVARLPPSLVATEPREWLIRCPDD